MLSEAGFISSGKVMILVSKNTQWRKSQTNAASGTMNPPGQTILRIHLKIHSGEKSIYIIFNQCELLKHRTHIVTDYQSAHSDTGQV